MNKESTMERRENLFLSSVIRVPQEGSKTWELRTYANTNHCLQHGKNGSSSPKLFQLDINKI